VCHYIIFVAVHNFIKGKVYISSSNYHSIVNVPPMTKIPLIK
jgi:hypothetical protein